MSKQNEGDRIVEKIKVAELIPYINNSRTHSEDQVAINRWQEFTGGNAILESSSESFNDLKGG